MGAGTGFDEGHGYAVGAPALTIRMVRNGVRPA
jgi:hypothetical protein